jgi:hypothetical protein
MLLMIYLKGFDDTTTTQLERLLFTATGNIEAYMVVGNAATVVGNTEKRTGLVGGGSRRQVEDWRWVVGLQ